MTNLQRNIRFIFWEKDKSVTHSKQFIYPPVFFVSAERKEKSLFSAVAAVFFPFPCHSADIHLRNKQNRDGKNAPLTIDCRQAIFFLCLYVTRVY